MKDVERVVERGVPTLNDQFKPVFEKVDSLLMPIYPLFVTLISFHKNVDVSFCSTDVV